RVLASVEATGVFPPFWKTSYPPSPIPPALSVEAFQTSVIVLAVCAVLCRPVGALGGVWSLDGLVVATASLLSCEELPAASRATINFLRSLGTTELLLRSTGTGGVAATDVLALAKDGRAGCKLLKTFVTGTIFGLHEDSEHHQHLFRWMEYGQTPPVGPGYRV